MEEELVPSAGFRLETLRVRGFDRDAPWKNLALPWLLPSAVLGALRVVDRFRPHVVLGVGGYAMAPGVVAARRRRLPYVLQVFEARGLANRLFRSGAAAAAVTFPADVVQFPTRRTLLTGYPLRPGFERGSPRVPPERLLVMGGSLGARRLNHAVWGSLDQLLGRFREVVHLTGRQGEEEAARLARPGYRPLGFSTEVARLMAEADLVVCRAGVGACAEVTAVGLPAVLVPGSFGGGHQERNARQLVEAGAAVRLGDDELSPEALLRVLSGLDDGRLRSMAEASRALGRPDAARSVVHLLEEVAGEVRRGAPR